MSAKYFLIIRNYVLSVSSQRKYNFYHQNTHLDAYRMNYRTIIGRNPSMVNPLLATHDLTPMLANTMFCKRSNLIHRSVLIKDLSCLGVLDFSGLSARGSFLTFLDWYNFLRTAKAALFEQPKILAISP